MKKIFLPFIITIAFFLPQGHLFAQTSKGQTSAGTPQSYPIPPDRNGIPQLLGQNQAYSVTFRGNGEAVIALKTVFSNQTDNPLSLITFRVPKVDPKDIMAFQVIREGKCLSFKQPSPDAKPGAPLVCTQFAEPDYVGGYYGASKYQKAQALLRGDTIEITLPQTVKPETSGSIILYYRAFGYAKKKLFGAYGFTFETAKTEDFIRDLTVGISTDSDLILKGAKGNVNYRFESGMTAMRSAGEGSALSNPQFDRYYQQIGYGTITKKASNLQPLDSYTVKGTYAENSLILYDKEIGIAVTLFLLGAAILVLVGKKLMTWVFAGMKKPEKTSNNIGIDIALASGVGFTASFSIILYTAGLIAFASFTRQMYVYNEFLFIINILLAMITIAVYAFLLFVPPFVVGIKKNIILGIGTFCATIVFLIVDIIFVLMLMFIFMRIPNRPSYPLQIMKNMMEGNPIRSNIERSTDATPMMGKTERISEDVQSK